MKFLTILIVTLTMTFASLGSTLFAQDDTAAVLCVEVSAEMTDTSESSDAEESDEPLYFFPGTGPVQYTLPSTYQRDAFRYVGGRDRNPSKPPSLNFTA
jgi:hypothetical protein